MEIVGIVSGIICVVKRSNNYDLCWRATDISGGCASGLIVIGRFG
jgi:hypothetical protein